MKEEKNIRNATLLLEDGTVYTGKAIGVPGTTTGEICFCTGMTGYQEVYTDPSYYGQILIQTNIYVGNYGYREDEVESSSIKIAGLICRNFSDVYSRPLADGSLEDYFEKNNLVGISGVDTRALVRHVRTKGAMNAIISSEETDIEKLKQKLAETPSMKGLELSSKVTTKEPYFLGDKNNPYKVAVLDLGVKQHILKNLADRGCYLKVFPAKTSLEEMKQDWDADGYFISNGPGDPAAMDYAIETVKEILAEDKPLFGICLGQQILASAVGLPTYKMHFGHRGLNHPVKNINTGKCEITTQNHGFGVDPEAIRQSDKVEITHMNLNDGTIEGIRIKNKKAFSVQFHPESTPGPYDSRYLFDEFVSKLKAAVFV